MLLHKGVTHIHSQKKAKVAFWREFHLRPLWFIIITIAQHQSRAYYIDCSSQIVVKHILDQLSVVGVNLH